jgi:hypothetical protein
MKGPILVLLLAAMPVRAEERVPDFDTCIDIAAARFERELAWHRASPLAEVFAVGDGFHLRFCGDAGAWHCDRTGAPVPCLTALTERQQHLRRAVLASLPAPEDVQGRRGLWSDDLYPRMHALAQGRSAGPDCAGLPEAATLRCEVRDAALRVSIAMRAWYLARYLGAAPDAITAGWAAAPPPTRPRTRPDTP